MVFVFLYEALQHLGHCPVLAQVGRFGEHLGKLGCKAVVGHRVLDLLAVVPPLGLASDGEALLQLVAGLGHHRTVYADKVHVAYLLLRIERREPLVEQPIGLLEEVKADRRQARGYGTARDLHVNGEVEQRLELLAGKHGLQFALAQTVGTQQCIYQKIKQTLALELFGTIVYLRVLGKFWPASRQVSSAGLTEHSLSICLTA